MKELRTLATAGTHFAVSLSPPVTASEQPDGRLQFRAAIAALGELARNALSYADAAELIAAARWRPVEITERSQSAGFVVAAPAWEPARDHVVARLPTIRARAETIAARAVGTLSAGRTDLS